MSSFFFHFRGFHLRISFLNQRLGMVNETMNEAKVLVLYTSGTIGMRHTETGYTRELHYLPKTIRTFPPLHDANYHVQSASGQLLQPFVLPPIRHMQRRVVYWIAEYESMLGNSGDVTFDDWIRIARDIEKAYEQYDGFVVLHGTNTMAYTACALSFMLENLKKPVILTGAQISVSEARSDGRENLIGALIVAGNLDIPEVTVYFNSKLMRGNRSVRMDSSGLQSLDSPNMNPLVVMKIDIEVNYDCIFRPPSNEPFCIQTNLFRNIGVLRLFPSILIDTVRSTLQERDGVVLQTFSVGQLPSQRIDIMLQLQRAVDRGCIIVNCSQCIRGLSEQPANKILQDIGIISGSDMSIEAALAKLAYVLGKDEWNLEQKKKMMGRNLRGELSSMRNAQSLLLEADFAPRVVAFFKSTANDETIAIHRDAIIATLTMNAARLGDVKMLQLLSQQGVDLHAVDHNDETALHAAASSNQPAALIFLIDNGLDVNAKNYCGETALTQAVNKCHIACVRILVAAKAMLNIGDDQQGDQLRMAAKNGDLDKVKVLCLAGIALNFADRNGFTALHWAAQCRNKEMVTFLIGQGANAGLLTSNGHSALDIAIANGEKGCIAAIKDAVEGIDGEKGCIAAIKDAVEGR